jgi:hypothetical protein
MNRLRTLTSIAAAALTLAAAPAALAHTTTVGNASGTPTMNICLLSFDCTYLNYSGGKPTDVVAHKGMLVSWSLNAASMGGQVYLRVLRPVGAGNYKAVHTSLMRTTYTTGINTFPAHIKVHKGDVIALENATSGIYMGVVPSGNCIRYFDYADPISDGATGAPDKVTPQLHTLLSAQLKY